MMSQRVITIAHRGASGTRPENTLSAFRRAIEVGADMIELDLRASADGVAVVMHDAAVDRTTDGSGAVSELTLKQLRALDAGAWRAPDFAGERVPDLAEVVALTAGRIGLDLELKVAGVEEQALEAVQRVGDGWSFISSFHDESLAQVRQLDPSVRTGLIVGINPLGEDEIRRLVERVQGLGASILAASYRGITPALMEAAAAAGISVIAWTVDERDDMRRMLELGVAGIASNYPETLIDTLRAPKG